MCYGKVGVLESSKASATHSASTKALSSRVAVITSLFRVRTFSLLTTKDIQLIDEVHHAVRVNAIRPRVSALVGADIATNAALFAKDVVELE